MLGSEKIDAVYTWVDCEDFKWQAEFNQSQAQIAARPSTHRCRFRDHGELNYSLLSLEQFAPWIHHIFIVKKPYQFPNLERLSPEIMSKVIWVDETTLRPPELDEEDFCPTFNSLAIEANLHRIEDLSERFIYFNNDMFLGQSILPDYFYMGTSARFSLRKYGRFTNGIKKIEERLKKPFVNGYRQHLYNAYQLFKQEIISPQNLGVASHHLPLHQCCPLFKSSYAFLWNQEAMKQALLLTSASKFRKDSNIHSVFLCGLVQLWLGKASIVIEEDQFIELGKRNFQQKLKELTQERAYRFCINDHPRNKNDVKSTEVFHEFMQNYFVEG